MKLNKEPWRPIHKLCAFYALLIPHLFPAQATSKASTQSSSLGLFWSVNWELRVTCSGLVNTGRRQNPGRLEVTKRSRKEAGGRGRWSPGRTRSQTPRGRFYRSPWQHTSSHPPPESEGGHKKVKGRQSNSVSGGKRKAEEWGEVLERAGEERWAVRGNRRVSEWEGYGSRGEGMVQQGRAEREKQRKRKKIWTFLVGQ